MDFSSLKEQVSNLTLYDIKAGVRKVQNGTSQHNNCSCFYASLILGMGSCHELYRNGGQGPRSHQQ